MKPWKTIIAIGLLILGLLGWGFYVSVIGRTYSGSVDSVEKLPLLSDDLREVYSGGLLHYHIHRNARGQQFLVAGSSAEHTIRGFVTRNRLEGSAESSSPKSLAAAVESLGASKELFGLKCDQCYECYWLQNVHDPTIVKAQLWYCPKTGYWVVLAIKANN